MKNALRVAVVAPACRLTPEMAADVAALAAARFPEVSLLFHPQCFLNAGHFAGEDAARTAALVEAANDPEMDAVWFARGGYGACRIAEPVLAQLGPAARQKAYLGYSDTGSLLAGLYRKGFGRVAHGPMPADIARTGGEAAVLRALAWLTARPATDVLEAGLVPGQPAAAFNLTILSHLLGTPLEPDLAGHVLLLEEVSEHMYRIDRALFHVTSHPSIRRAAGIRLGRCSQIPPNDPPFEKTEVEVAEYWCARAGIPYLGRADIGHDAGNKVVPFGARPAV